MELTPEIEAIARKVEAGQELTWEEDVLYLMFTFGMTRSMAENVMAITTNDDPGLIVD